MKHSFTRSATDKFLCGICHRNYLVHTNIASCDSCARITTCEIFGQPSDLRAPLLCAECEAREKLANSAILMHTQATINQSIHPDKSDGAAHGKLDVWGFPTDGSYRTSTQELIAKSRSIDQSIKTNGDFFNADTIAINQIKQTIMSDPNIPSDAKQFVYQEELTIRFEQLSKVIFQHDTDKHRLVTAQLAITNDLRSFGNSLRNDLRERIKASDTNYSPPSKSVVIPKVVKPKVSVEDRLIEMKALMDGISKEQARELLRNLQSAQHNQGEK